MSDTSTEPNLKLISTLVRLESPLLIIVAFVAGGILCLWMLPFVPTFVPAAWLKMSPATAIGILLAAGSLGLSAPRSRMRSLPLSESIAVVVLALGLVGLLIYSTGAAFSVGRWIRLPSPQTALSFTLAGICLAFVGRASDKFSTSADLCTLALAGLVMFFLGGYLFGVNEFVGIDASNVISVPTLLCFGILTFAIAVRRSIAGGLFSVFVNGGIGSRITRTVLPFIVAAPYILFLLVQYLNDTGILSTAPTRAILAPLVALMVTGVVAWMGSYTNWLERELRLLSFTDQLTSVLNRRGFETVAEDTRRSASRSGTDLILFYFDLDGLKRVNDSMGHGAGSEMIRRFAELLVNNFRKNDVVARIGGDEFAVLAVCDSGSASQVIQRLEMASEQNAAGAEPYPISYSVGFAEISPTSAKKFEDFVIEADTMMYKRKGSKKASNGRDAGSQPAARILN